MEQDRLSRFEDRIRFIVEGSLVRLLSGQFHPGELTIGLSRAMTDHSEYSKDGKLIAPDEYTIRLNPQDHAFILETEPTITTTLADELVQLARQENILLLSSPSVRLLADDEIRVHHVSVNATYLTFGTDTTRTLQRTPSAPERIPNALLVLSGEQQIPITNPVVNIGRQRDNHIVLDDASVSRRHAQIRLRFGQYVLFDLGSTVGTIINGHPVQEAVLHSGDVIALGTTRLIYIEDTQEDLEDTASLSREMLE
jgi:hypothetical protein